MASGEYKPQSTVPKIEYRDEDHLSRHVRRRNLKLAKVKAKKLGAPVQSILQMINDQQPF